MNMENRETMVQKGLSEWWSEETEYIFQRIERWAAFARGYNRLQSQRWFKNQQTMEESWSVSSGEIPRCHPLKRPRWKSRPEEIKINCCGTFNYQSNNRLDSNCLETYRYDHSIYFKTVGDIRSDKRNQNQDSTSVSSEEQIEWDANSFIDPVSNKVSSEEIKNISNTAEYIAKREDDRTIQNVWPIVDLSKLNLNLTDNREGDKWLSHSVDEDDNRRRDERQTENNMIFLDNLTDRIGDKRIK